MTAALAIVGRSGSGKTSLIVSLIPVLQDRGYTVATIKHAGHGFELDQPGKDSWRHYHAGAQAVVVASSSQVVLMKRVQRDPPLQELLALLSGDYDLVIAEGYKETTAAKGGGVLRLEVIGDGETGLLSHPASLDAIVSDSPVDIELPRFSRRDVRGIADFVSKNLLAPAR